MVGGAPNLTTAANASKVARFQEQKGTEHRENIYIRTSVRLPNHPEKELSLLTSFITACWASTGYASATCSGVEQALRQCMDGPQAPAAKRNNINYHLSRFQKHLEGHSNKKK